MGKFKTHDGDHREQIPGTLEGTSRQGQGHTFASASPTGSPNYEDPESRSWVRVGWGREEDRSSPDPVLTVFPTSIGRKNSSAI